MKPNQIARHYRELAIKAATPVGLIVLLYDMAIESLSHAVREIDAGDIEARTADLNHALTVIASWNARSISKREARSPSAWRIFTASPAARFSRPTSKRAKRRCSGSHP